MELIFDTHAHYDDEAFDDDRDALLASFAENGVGTVVNVAASLSSCETTVALARTYPFIYAAVGVHPTETAELETLENGDGDRAAAAVDPLSRVRELLNEEKTVALGEIGLDYYWDEPERGIQKKWFVRQLALAKETGYPVIIHSREAAKDTLDIMKAEHAGETGGVIHCFSYGVEIAREYLDMGYYLGIGGVLTYKNAKKLLEVVEYAPLDRLVLETDSPYLTPVPNRGKRNSSLYLPAVVAVMAQLKGMTEEEIIRATAENARRLYRLDERLQ